MIEADKDPIVSAELKLFVTRYSRWLTLRAEVDGNAANDKGKERDESNNIRLNEMEDLARCMIATPSLFLDESWIRRKFEVIDFFVDGDSDWTDARLDLVIAALKADVVGLRAGY